MLLDYECWDVLDVIGLCMLGYTRCYWTMNAGIY